MRVRVFPFDTCWLIESIRLSLFISFSPRLGTHFCHQQDGSGTAGRTRFGLTGLHLIFRIRMLLRLTQTPPGLLAVLFVFTCALQESIKKGAACFLVRWWPGNTGGLLEQTECRCLWCGKKKGGCGKKRSKQMKGWRRRRRGGITSSLPTRQPWVRLLCWSECNRPGFFSLTTGACEHTSSPPWERRLSWQSQCLCLFFFSFTVPSCSSSMSLSHPVLISVLFVLALCLVPFSLSHCI